MGAILDKDLNTNEGYFDDDDQIEDPDFTTFINGDGYPISDDFGEQNFDGGFNFE